MDIIIRAVVIYLVLLIIMRLAGRRTLGEMTSFDLILLLIISEAIQQGLIGDDFSLTTAILLIITLISLDILFTYLKQKSKLLDRLIDGTPTIIVDEGKLLTDRMNKARVDESDILTAARELHGLERLEQIKYAVLERNGKISIIPRS